MLRERGNTSSTRKVVVDPRISYELGKIRQLIPRITYGTTFPHAPKVGDLHFYQGEDSAYVTNNWYAAKPDNGGWQSVNATAITGENISGAIPSGVTIADYLSKFGGTMEGIITFFKDQILPAEMIKGEIPAGVTISDYLNIYGGTVLGSIIMSGFNLTRLGILTGYDSDIKITMNEDGKLSLNSDVQMILQSALISLLGAVTVSVTLQLALGAAINEFSTDGTLADNSDTAVPTEKAVKTYIDSLPLADDVVCDESDAITLNGDLVYAIPAW